MKFVHIKHVKYIVYMAYLQFVLQVCDSILVLNIRTHSYIQVAIHKIAMLDGFVLTQKDYH